MLRTGAMQTSAGLFVIADAAALVADFRHKGLLGNRLGRSGLREVIVHRVDASLGRFGDRIEDSLSEWVVLSF